MICTYSIALWVCLFCVSSLPVPFYSGWFHANIWDDAFCDHNYCKCCVLLGNGIARAVSFYEFLVFLCQFVAKSISFRSSHRSCSVEKVFLEIFQNPQKITCGRVSFNKFANLKPATLLQKKLWHRPFSVNFVKYLRTPFFTPLVAASARYRWLGSSSSFQVVRVCSRWFQLVRRFSM